MKKREHGNSPALILSALSAIVLFVALYMVIEARLIQSTHYEFALVTLSFFCIALLSVLLYQSFTIKDHAEKLARDLTRGMFQYPPELFTDVYAQSQVPYMIIDAEGYIESVNYSMARLFNVNTDALLRLDVFHFFQADATDNTALIPEYFRKGKHVNEVEVGFTRPDGMHKWATLSLFPFRDRSGNRKGLLSLLDITKQKLVDAAKTEFVSLASHQLRTPISGIKWNLELLLSADGSPLSQLQLSYLDKIRNGLVRMELLVGDFLSAARFELGTLTPQYTEFDISEFVAKVKDEHQIRAEKKKITYTLAYEGEQLTTVRSDSHLCHMVMSNLTENALKYTPDGGTVRVVVSADPHQFRFSVLDTGIGIPNEEREMVFSKMFRASNARTAVAEGTGLGLYIVREAARVLGGDVTFTSAHNEGSTFVFSLPRTALTV